MGEGSAACAGDDNHDAAVRRMAEFVNRCGGVATASFDQLNGASAFGFDDTLKRDAA
jgi:hypothetical protein